MCEGQKDKRLAAPHKDGFTSTVLVVSEQAERVFVAFVIGLIIDTSSLGDHANRA